jgi:hypothetical protein
VQFRHGTLRHQPAIEQLNQGIEDHRGGQAEAVKVAAQFRDRVEWPPSGLPT